MKNLLIPVLALLGLGLSACTAEKVEPQSDQGAQSAPKAELVTFKIDGMT